jgi:hypothetical protein
MIVVSFTAPIGGGKDASAKLLSDLKLSEGKLSFAGPMKDICSKVFNISREDMEDPVKKIEPFKEPFAFTRKHLRQILNMMVEFLPTDEFAYNVGSVSEYGIVGTTMTSIRHILQFVGTEVIREKVHPDWHLQAAFSNRVLSRLNPEGTYCITDARFPNEFTFLRDKFAESFYGYYVERPEAEERLKAATHPSERKVVEVRELVGEENVIVNDGDLEDLANKLKKLPFVTGAKPASSTKKGKSSSKFKFTDVKGRPLLGD